MTKRNKKNIKPIMPIIIIKCNCGENTEQGKANCNRFPECCDNDLIFI
jgi:hypothetical protein